MHSSGIRRQSPLEYQQVVMSSKHFLHFEVMATLGRNPSVYQRLLQQFPLSAYLRSLPPHLVKSFISYDKLHLKEPSPTYTSSYSIRLGFIFLDLNRDQLSFYRLLL
jgi:hypothetical protein